MPTKKEVVSSLQLIPVLIFGVAALLYLRKRDEEPKQVPPSATASVSALATDNVESVKKLLAAAVERLPPPQTTVCTPLKRFSVLPRINQAKELIAKQEMLEHAWQWEKVRNFVAHIGNTIPVCEEPMGLDVPLALIYQGQIDMVQVWSAHAEEETIEGLASALVHEATHRIVRDEMIAVSSFTKEEILAMVDSCQGFSSKWKVATEALSFENQAAWHAAHPDANASTIGKQYKDLIAKANGANAGKVPVFAEALYATVGRTSYLHKGQSASDFNCGPPYCIRGAYMGGACELHMIAPERLAPILKGSPQGAK